MKIFKIAVIVINYNGKGVTVECLKSLTEVKTENFSFEVIIIDNKSTDDSRLEIKNFLKKFVKINNTQKNYTLIENQENLGFCQANNIGIKKALKEQTEFILILNNDTVVDSKLLINLLKGMQENYRAGILAPKIYFAPGFEFHAKRYSDKEKGKVIWYAGGLIDWNNLIFSHHGIDEVDKGQFAQTVRTEFASGCAMFVRREVFERTGFFDEKYFMYLEDVDFCQRARHVDFDIMYEPKAVVWHKNASASGKPGSYIHVYYQTRNRLIFGFKYASFKTKYALFRESIKILFENSIRKTAVLDYYTHNLGRKYDLP